MRLFNHLDPHFDTFKNKGYLSTLITKSLIVHFFVEQEWRVPPTNDKILKVLVTGFDLGRLIWARPNARAEMEGVIMSKTIYMKEKSEYLGWHVMDVELKGCPRNLQFSEVRKSLARGRYGGAQGRGWL